MAPGRNASKPRTVAEASSAGLETHVQPRKPAAARTSLSATPGTSAGTRVSVLALEALTKDKNKGLAGAAQDALKAIKGRDKP